MNDSFKEEIRAYPYPLFYNTSGTPLAYKLSVRHLGASVTAGLASTASGFIYPHNELHLVNFDEEKIEVITERIKLIELKSLK